jgi:hypothetical protein
MATDRTQEFWGCVEGVWLRQRLPEVRACDTPLLVELLMMCCACMQDQLRQLKESYILRPARTPSAFAKVAAAVVRAG